MACFSGLTDGVYRYYDCCGNFVVGVSLGETICFDSAYSASTFGVYNTMSACTPTCDDQPLGLTFTITGTCSSPTGSVTFSPYGGIPPYTIDNIQPGGISAQTSSSPITFSGLTADTYVFRLNDSEGFENNELYINVIITGCFYTDIIDVTPTTCGENNGTLTVSADSQMSPYTLILSTSGGTVESQVTTLFPYTFTNLSADTYFVQVVDYGLSTATTSNAIVSSSSNFDFSFWKVNTSTCVINEGKLSITGLTGTPPYTYLWNDGQTGQTITGLTIGTYSCTVTDGNGCVVTKSDTIGEADPLGVGIVTSVNPSCFSSDGSITFTITGGSVPYYYSASTSQVGYTLSNTLTLSGLSSGNYNLEITDANFCKQIISAFINAENSFFIVDTVVTNSNCSQQLGSLTVSLQGSNNFYSYILSGQTNGLVYTNTTQSLTSTFSGLTNDTYDLIISATGTNCEYTTTVTLASTDKFEISATTTGSTCSQNDGGLQVQVGTGYTSPLDYILSDGQSILDTSLSSYTFNNLVAGSYTLTVVDADGCQIDEQVTISTGGSLISAISTTQCYGGQNGTAQVLIYDGEPTFSYDWSDNVPSGQTGSTISGLTAGTYSVEVTDSSGCSQTHNFTITCSGNNVTTYSVVELCQNEFATTVGAKRGFLEMLNEGYIDVTSGYTGCSLNTAEFILEMNINGSAFTQTFYTATTLNDVPQDTLWQSTIEGILSGVTDISSYTISLTDNTIHIESNCEGDTDPLADANFTLELTIDYDVTCYT